MRYRKKGKGWQSGMMFLAPPVSAFTLCTLWFFSPFSVAKNSPLSTSPPPINDTSFFYSASLSSPTNTPSICDQRLKAADKEACEEFIKKYPGEYTTTFLSGDEDVIIQNKSHQIYYLSGAFYDLSYPIIVKDSSHIAIFSLPDSDGNAAELGLRPQTPGKDQPGRKNYYGKEVIGDIHNCDSCLVSGFYIYPEVGSSNKSLNRAFEIAGKNTQISFHNIHPEEPIPNGYFNAKNIKHISIEHFWVSGEDSEKTLNSPAIKIRNCDSIELKNIRLTDLEAVPYGSDKGVISIVNPVKFTIDQITLALKDSDSNYVAYVAGIYILFDGKNNFKKYRPDELGRAISVDGKILNSRIYEVAGNWDSDWKGVVLTSQPKHQRPKYHLVDGRILISNTSLLDKWGKATKYNLPNIRIDYWTDPATASTMQPTTLAERIIQARLNTARSVIKSTPSITDYDDSADNPATTKGDPQSTPDALTTIDYESSSDGQKTTKGYPQSTPDGLTNIDYKSSGDGQTTTKKGYPQTTPDAFTGTDYESSGDGQTTTKKGYPQTTPDAFTGTDYESSGDGQKTTKGYPQSTPDALTGLDYESSGDGQKTTKGYPHSTPDALIDYDTSGDDLTTTIDYETSGDDLTTTIDYESSGDSPAPSPGSLKITTGTLKAINDESQIDDQSATKRGLNSGGTEAASSSIFSLLIPLLTVLFK